MCDACSKRHLAAVTSGAPTWAGREAAAGSATTVCEALTDDFIGLELMALLRGWRDDTPVPATLLPD